MSYKKTDELMQHLRDHGVLIQGEEQKCHRIQHNRNRAA